MPGYRKGYKKPTYRKRMAPKKTYKKSFRYPDARISFTGPRSFPTGPFPNETFRKLQFTQSLSHTALTAAVPTVSSTFRLNNLYDMDTAVGGGQPLGYDQLGTVYNRYAVTGGTITLEWMYAGDGKTAYTPIVMGFFLSKEQFPYGVSFLTSWQGVQEWIKPANKTTGTLQHQGQVNRITRKFDLAKLFGVSPSTLINDDTYAGQFDGNAVPQPYFVHVVTTLPYLLGAGTVSNNILKVTITTDVNVRELKVLQDA